MDEKVAKWILDFLLRQPIDENIINGVLSCLPLSNYDNRLKKMILLRTLESEISNVSISEKLLELFEIIEELDHKEGKAASGLMKYAYCAVAVDCTLRFLGENVEKNGKYFEAVERVWRNRVCLMEGLGSEKSNRWLADIEAAIWDSEVCGNILTGNTRNEALKAVRGYLEEAWTSMGPAFLERVAKVGDQVEDLLRGSSGGAMVGLDTPGCKLVVSQGMQKDQTIIRRKHVAVKTKCPRGAKISDADEEDVEEFLNTANDVPIHKTDKVQDSLQTNSMPAAGDSHPDASQAAHKLSLTKDDDVPAHKIDKMQALQSRSMQLHASVSDTNPDASQAACASSFIKVTDNSNDVKAVENQTGPVIHASSEVTRQQEALKSSAKELHAAVTDPLPQETAHYLSLTKDDDVSTHKMDKLQALQSRPMQLLATVSDTHPDASRAACAPFTKVTDNSNDVKAVENQTGCVIHASPEVTRLQEELKSSAKELHAAVTEPLPEAVQMAETVCSTLVTVTHNHGTFVENQTGAETHAISEVNRVQQALETSSMGVHAARKNPGPDASQTVENVSSKTATKVSNDAVSANQKQPGNHAPRESIENNPENVKKNDKHMGHAEGSDTHDQKELPKCKRSLMEPNGTSHTFEWDDSTDNISRGLHVRLPPSSKRSKVAPLQLYEDKKLRRERKKWTPQEEDTLKNAVHKFGKRWKFILESFRDVFNDRTDIDLKDKWRNMLKSQL